MTAEARLAVRHLGQGMGNMVHHATTLYSCRELTAESLGLTILQCCAVLSTVYPCRELTAESLELTILELTAESLELMKPAWPGVAALFPALMSMEVWGGLVGMFELNNLAMAVPSPVEDYFLLVRTPDASLGSGWLAPY
eukprot:1138866-Pelagomonas_calceolata.AAC.3